MAGFDPFGSIQRFTGQFQGFMRNPMQFLIQNKLNIPQEYMNDPNKAIQYLMNNGTMTQEQYNALTNISKQIQSNPQFQQLINQNQK